MGISTRVYAVFGVKIDWDSDLNEVLEERYEEGSPSSLPTPMLLTIWAEAI